MQLAAGMPQRIPGVPVALAKGRPWCRQRRRSAGAAGPAQPQLKLLERLPACCLASATALLIQACPTPACWLPVGCLYQ